MTAKTTFENDLKLCSKVYEASRVDLEPKTISKENAMERGADCDYFLMNRFSGGFAVVIIAE